jgi:hypothetical protein
VANCGRCKRITRTLASRIELMARVKPQSTRARIWSAIEIDI